ncbi:MAG: PKD domain-containing protein [Flavipsychrobacter sp.]
MRKLVLFTAILASFVVNAVAQTYYPVTHTTGTQTVSGVAVTVTNSTGRTNATPQYYCNAGPYYIGVSQPGGYVHSFSPGVTHVRLSITDFHSDDSVRVNVNGSSYPITFPMLSDYTPCGDLSGLTNIPPDVDVVGGLVVNRIGGAARRDVSVVISTSPGFINNIEVLHDRVNTSSSGFIYGLEFALDTCLQKFEAWTTDTVQCRTRDLHLFATNFPNTTYSWTAPGSPVWVPSNTVYDPVVKSLPLTTADGNYIVTATRGACVYKDTVVVSVKQTPGTPLNPITYRGPKCAGDKDTVSFVSNLTAGGTTYIIKPSGQVVTCNIPPLLNFIELPNIQIADAGTYKGFSKSTEGCYTDTFSVVVSLSPQAQADFSYNAILGCDADTVKFTDQSNGINIWNWNFGDGGTSNIDNPTHTYPASSGTYNVKLVVSNGTCADSVTKQIVLNHPLVADFDMSVDSICQGKLVTFTNNSSATPATLPTYFWDFKDGNTSDQYNVTHTFLNYGVYNIEMTITDYLGCKKTATKTLVVDSLGSANFLSDSVICAGESIKFLGDYSTIGGTYAEWNFGDGHVIKDKFTIEHAYDNPGTYLVQLTANYRICPDTTYDQNVYVKPYPTIDLGKDTSLCPDGNPFIIKDMINASTAGVRWHWNTETKDTGSYINVHHPGKYAVTVDLDGCSATDTIEVKKNCYIDIPNVFTPNGDGYNDYFLPRQLLSRSVTKFSMTIFNRWGEVIFETNSINGRGWDGKVNDKEQPTGVYVYMIKATFANGYSENYQGNVTLLR